MAHRHPDYPYFTREICKRGLLREAFRLVDVGVRGGIANHWLNFGDHLHAWGFDVLDEDGVRPLIEANPHPERLHYLNIGLGDEDATRAFKFYPDNPSASHFAASNGSDQVDESWQNVSIRRLDTLYADGTIGAVDFMKMDAEAHEVEIVKGAGQFFLNSGIFGVESEASFARTRRNPQSHFVELYKELAPYGFTVYDAGPHRLSRPALARGFPRERAADEFLLEPVGPAQVFDFLFLNHIFGDPAERLAASARQSVADIDRLLKMIAVAEVYGLQDVGLELLLTNRTKLGSRLDVEEAANWLVRHEPCSKLTYQQYLTGIDSNDAAVFPGATPDIDGSVLNSKFVDLRGLLEERERQLAETRALLAEREGQLGEKERQVLETRALLTEKERQVRDAQAHLVATRKSRSWRVTAPFRKATTWFRQ